VKFSRVSSFDPEREGRDGPNTDPKSRNASNVFPLGKSLCRMIVANATTGMAAKYVWHPVATNNKMDAYTAKRNDAFNPSAVDIDCSGTKLIQSSYRTAGSWNHNCSDILF